MNKLEPILRYHFWILLALGLILAFTGWWMTTGEMQGAITKRSDDIKKAKEKVDGLKEVPGQDWESKLKVINAEQEKLIRKSRELLYVRQKERMVWPEVLREVAAKMKYREDFNNPTHHINYRDHYLQEVQRVYEIPRPITGMDENGVVFFPFSVMPHRDWGDLPPSNKQMWDSMEDLWLLEPILQAILETNGGPTATRYDASVVAIEKLALRGGDRAKIGQSNEPAAGAMGAGAGGGGPAGFGLGAAETKGGGGGGGGGGPMMAAMSGPVSSDIKEFEEFGDPGSEGADTGGGQSGPGAGAGAAMPPGMMAGEMKGGGGGGGASAYSDDVGRRYIDDDPALPYRTRGFKLSVVMDHRKVPDLYAQLTSSERSPWPVKILRFNIARLSDSGSGSGGFEAGMGVAGAGGFPGAGGGFPGGANGPGGFPAGGGFPAARPGGFPAARPGGAIGGGLMRAGLGARGDDDDRGPRGNFAADAPAANDQMENPFLARVTFVGLITLYNEPPKVEEPAPAQSSAPPPQVGDLPSAEPAAEGDGEEAGAGEMPSEEPEDGVMEATEIDEAAEMTPEIGDEPAGEDAPADGPKDEKPDEDKPAADEPAEPSGDDAAAVEK